MAPVIRHFEAADYTAARALWEETPGVGLSAADERGPIKLFLSRNPGLSFVASDGGLVVGTILCGHDGRRGLIHHLAAARSHRRQGLGRDLLRASLRALALQGIEKCHLLVFRDNAEGLEFWRAVEAAERNELAVFSISTQSAT